MKPMKFSSMPDLPNCAPLISTTCSQGWLGLSASMIARWYGARSVRHSPRSAADSELSRRFSSAHCETVMSGGGSRTSCHRPGCLQRAYWISSVDSLQEAMHLALQDIAHLAFVGKGGYFGRQFVGTPRTRSFSITRTPDQRCPTSSASISFPWRVSNSVCAVWPGRPCLPHAPARSWRPLVPWCRRMAVRKVRAVQRLWL